MSTLPLYSRSIELPPVFSTEHIYRSRFSEYRGLRKIEYAAYVLHSTWSIIKHRGLTLSLSYHFLDRFDRPIGLSGGEVAYSANNEGIRKIGELVVQWEDRRFYSHCGVDGIGILRAVVANCRARRIVQGAGTITQQVIRNIVLTPERSWLRKAIEIVLAIKLERHYSKAEILDLYCQAVILGPGVRGFEACSKLIYRKPSSDLTYFERLSLIGLLRRPSVYYPSVNMNAFIRRAELVRDICTRSEHCATGMGALEFHDSIHPNPIRYHPLRKPRWSTLVRDFYPVQRVGRLEGPTRVGLTIDRCTQAVVDRIGREISLLDDNDRTACVVIENRTGNVLAESSWQRGKEQEFSPSMKGQIQPGSTFKPFAFLAALDAGYAPNLELESAPYQSDTSGVGDRVWRVRNYRDRYSGIRTIQDALIASDNTVFARLTDLIDNQSLWDVYHDFCLIKESVQLTRSIVLGALPGGVSLHKLASAYASLANGGVYTLGRLIRFAAYHDETFVYVPEPAQRLVATSTYAIDVLQRVLPLCCPTVVKHGWSGKTGTTQFGSIFAGYNEKVSIALWLSHRSMRDERSSKGMTAIQGLERMIQAALGYKDNVFSI